MSSTNPTATAASSSPSHHPTAKAGTLYTALLSAITLSQARLADAKMEVEDERRKADMDEDISLGDILTRPDELAANMRFRRMIFPADEGEEEEEGEIAAGPAICYIPIHCFGSEAGIQRVEVVARAEAEMLRDRNEGLAEEVTDLYEQVEDMRREILEEKEYIDNLMGEVTALRGAAMDVAWDAAEKRANVVSEKVKSGGKRKRVDGDEHGDEDEGKHDATYEDEDNADGDRNDGEDGEEEGGAVSKKA